MNAAHRRVGGGDDAGQPVVFVGAPQLRPQRVDLNAGGAGAAIGEPALAVVQIAAGRQLARDRRLQFGDRTGRGQLVEGGERPLAALGGAVLVVGGLALDGSGLLATGGC